MYCTGVEFCDNYDVDMDKLTELWLTFCVNNDADIQPTITNLKKMECMMLKKDYKLRKSHYSENDDVLSMYGCTESGPSSKVSFYNCFLYQFNIKSKYDKLLNSKLQLEIICLVYSQIMLMMCSQMHT